MGVLPDLLVFIPNGILRGGERMHVDESTVTADAGWFAWEAYQVTHSLVWMTLGFLLTWWWFERRGVSKRLIHGEMDARMAAFCLWLPWLLHILIDIPTHRAQFFPTPFLAPFSDFVVDGVRWSTPSVWFSNVAILVAMWAGILVGERRARAES